MNMKRMAESKTDLVGTLQKKQRNSGRYDAMKYFMQDDVKRQSWSAPIFNDGEVDSKDGAIIADGRIFVSSSKCCDVSRVVSRIGIFRSVSVGNFLGIYHTDIPKENSVCIFGIKNLAGAPQNNGGSPFFLRRGGPGPLLYISPSF